MESNSRREKKSHAVVHYTLSTWMKSQLQLTIEANVVSIRLEFGIVLIECVISDSGRWVFFNTVLLPSMCLFGCALFRCFFFIEMLMVLCCNKCMLVYWSAFAGCQWNDTQTDNFQYVQVLIGSDTCYASHKWKKTFSHRAHNNFWVGSQTSNVHQKNSRNSHDWWRSQENVNSVDRRDSSSPVACDFCVKWFWSCRISHVHKCRAEPTDSSTWFFFCLFHSLRCTQSWVF